MADDWKQKRLLKQQYRLVGNHSVVKICLWCKRALRKEGCCYKEKFYGVDTIGCVEMSPALTCNQRCKHCWRDNSVFSKGWEGPVDDPKVIVDGCIREREGLLVGFKGSDKTDIDVYNKALRPTHAAISLTGEPCLYPKLPELVKEFFKRNFKTVFLVTNGTVPEMLERFKSEKAPTNIYLSLEGPNDKDYEYFCNPVIEGSYGKVRQSERILKELRSRTRTVLRITCVKGFNMDKAEEFVSHVKRMQPDVIECKGYMHVGYSMKRLSRDNMPSFAEVRNFAEQLANLAGYDFRDEVQESSVILLSRPKYDK